VLTDVDYLESPLLLCQCPLERLLDSCNDVSDIRIVAFRASVAVEWDLLATHHEASEYENCKI
jgi:hypothetical protein